MKRSSRNYFTQPPLVLNDTSKAAPSTELEMLQNDHHIGPVGRLLFSSIVDSKPELDYALILPNAAPVNFDVGAFIHRRQIGVVELPEYTDKEQMRCLESGLVTSVTASAGLVRGYIDSTPAFIRAPNTSRYQEVYSVKFESALALGDCGSWVVNAESHTLYGHVITGSPEDGLAYIVPAYQVFEDLGQYFTHDRLEQYFARGNTDVIGVGSQFPIDRMQELSHYLQEV